MAVLVIERCTVTSQRLSNDGTRAFLKLYDLDAGAELSVMAKVALDDAVIASKSIVELTLTGFSVRRSKSGNLYASCDNVAGKVAKK